MIATLRRFLRSLGGMALALGIVACAGPTVVAAQARQTLTVERVDQLLMGSPELSQAFNALRTYYPTEYRAILQRFVALLRSGASLAATQQSSFGEMRSFMASRMDALAAAPDADLASLANAYRDLAETLGRVDVQLCAQWATTGFRPGSQPPPAVLQGLGRISALQITAAHRGEAGGGASRPPPDPATRQALFARLQAIDPASAGLIATGGVMNATPEQQCQTGRVLYGAVAELPAPQAAAVTVFLLQQYFRSPPS